MSMTLSEADKTKLVGALKDMSASMLRTSAERDLQKNIKGDICEELDLNKKVFAKLAKTFYKKNFTEEEELNKLFENLYKEVAK